MVDGQTVVRLLAAAVAATPIFHTEWHKYRAKQFEKGVGRAAQTDPKVQELQRRRLREGSEWKLWKSSCIGLGIVLGLASFFLGKMS